MRQAMMALSKRRKLVIPNRAESLVGNLLLAGYIELPKPRTA
jgi:hypothetical protein